jgi:hypothetical protein
MKNFMKASLPLLAISLLLASCHSGYEEKDGKIYYKWIHGGNWTRENTLVKEADAASFKTIMNSTNLNLGKDKNHVFKDASILEYADPLTFEEIKEYYWKDKNHVYLLQFGGTDCRIPNADPKTFLVVNDGLWAKDKNHVYYQFDQLNDVDPPIFIAIDENWGKDDRFYYYHNLRIDSLDYKTAEIISSYYIKDKNNVFFWDAIVKDANPKTFKADGVGSFGHDDKYMFNWEKNEGPITEQYKKTYIDNE